MGPSSMLMSVSVLFVPVVIVAVGVRGVFGPGTVRPHEHG